MRERGSGPGQRVSQVVAGEGGVPRDPLQPDGDLGDMEGVKGGPKGEEGLGNRGTRRESQRGKAREGVGVKA